MKTKFNINDLIEWVDYKVDNLKIYWRDFKNNTIIKWRLGFNPKETWNLDFTISQFILPRLKYFRKTTKAYPSYFKTPERWDKELDKMIAAFEILASEDDYFPTGCTYEEKQKIIDTGLKSFYKYYQKLWW